MLQEKEKYTREKIKTSSQFSKRPIRKTVLALKPAALKPTLK